MQVPSYWRLNAQRYRLEGSTCPSCGRPIFPPRPVCPDFTAHPERIPADRLPVFPALKKEFDTAPVKGR